MKPREIEYAVYEKPGLLDYFSYMYFGGSAISGPWFEYKDLMQCYRFEGHYKDVQKAHTFFPGLIKLLQVAVLVVYASIL